MTTKSLLRIYSYSAKSCKHIWKIRMDKLLVGTEIPKLGNSSQALLSIWKNNITLKFYEMDESSHSTTKIYKNFL